MLDDQFCHNILALKYAKRGLLLRFNTQVSYKNEMILKSICNRKPKEKPLTNDLHVTKD